MANLSRALVAVSGTLGQLANNAADREHERVMAMRQENLMRIQAALGEQARANERTFEGDQRKLDRDARRQEFETDRTTRREEAEADRRLRREEGEADRALRREEGAADRRVQMAQITDKEGKDYDARYMAQLNQIDKRIQDLNDYRTQGMAEGKFVDPAALSPIDAELAQLTEQRRTLAQERDITLARSGDNRYRKLSAAEVAAIRKENGGQMPGQAPTDPTEADMPMAAQGPRGGSSIKVPQAPPKPPGMVAREERKRPPTAKAGDSGLALGNWEDAQNMPPRAPEPSRAFQGARDLVNLGRDIVGGIESRKGEGSVVQAAQAALRTGKAPSAEVVQALAKIDRQRLTQVFGINEQDLAKLGL